MIRSPKAPTLLVHAHPDDEILSAGGWLCELQSRHNLAGVLTATRGEAGELRDEVKQQLELTNHSFTPLAISEIRMHEKTRALQAINIGTISTYWWGAFPARSPISPPTHYVDSGMRWGKDGLAKPAINAPSNAFALANNNDLLADLMAVVQHTHANSIITYDSAGGYGHPDHQKVAQICFLAAKALPLELWALKEDPHRQKNGYHWNLSALDKVCALDARKWRPQILAALRCYQSQLQVINSDTVLHVGGQTQRLLDREVLQQII